MIYSRKENAQIHLVISTFDDKSRHQCTRLGRLYFYFLSFLFYESEPFEILLDKDNLFTKNHPAENFWNVKRPTSKLFDDCCNEFHWCLNNVAKGIARDEVSYVMQMMNYVRDMLIVMLEWYVGMENDFEVTSGKFGYE